MTLLARIVCNQVPDLHRIKAEIPPGGECGTPPDATSVDRVAFGIADKPHTDHVAVIEAGAKRHADGPNVRPG